MKIKLYLALFLLVLVFGIYFAINMMNAGHDFPVTSSVINVINKSEHSRELSITTVNQEDTQEQLKIVVKDSNVWNLINEGETYLVAYRAPTSSSSAELLRINYASTVLPNDI